MPRSDRRRLPAMASRRREFRRAATGRMSVCQTTDDGQIRPQAQRGGRARSRTRSKCQATPRRGVADQWAQYPSGDPVGEGLDRRRDPIVVRLLEHRGVRGRRIVISRPRATAARPRPRSLSRRFGRATSRRAGAAAARPQNDVVDADRHGLPSCPTEASASSDRGGNRRATQPAVGSPEFSMSGATSTRTPPAGQRARAALPGRGRRSANRWRRMTASAARRVKSNVRHRSLLLADVRRSCVRKSPPVAETYACGPARMRPRENSFATEAMRTCKSAPRAARAP